MREILFRGKALKTSEWVFGFVQKKQVIGGVNWLIHEDLRASTAYHAPIVINPSTIGQYTGLTDKNGTKIFEGDILELINNDEDKSYYNVVWSTEDCRFKIREINLGEFFDDCDSWVHENMSVVGNIYDNPELLEE